MQSPLLCILSGIADKRDSGTASSNKRVSWAPLPLLGDEAEQLETAEAEVWSCLCTNLSLIVHLLGFATKSFYDATWKHLLQLIGS